MRRYRVSRSWSRIRMHPRERSWPIEAGSVVPWIARPRRPGTERPTHRRPSGFAGAPPGMMRPDGLRYAGSTAIETTGKRPTGVLPPRPSPTGADITRRESR